MLKRISLFLFCVGGLVLAEVRAQEQPSPRDFFPADFVNQGVRPAETPGPLSGALALGAKLHRADEKDSESAQLPTAAPPRNSLESDADAAFGRSDAARSVFGSAHGERVLSLGLVVNAVDEEHAKSAIEELIEVAQQYSIPLSTVYAVGGIAQAQKKLPAVEYMWAKTIGAKIKISLAVPKEYRVELSPAWIVETDQGLVLLDGLSSIRKALNAEGNFELVSGMAYSVAIME